jgi:hypothetical protein
MSNINKSSDQDLLGQALQVASRSYRYATSCTNSQLEQRTFTGEVPIVFVEIVGRVLLVTTAQFL